MRRRTPDYELQMALAKYTELGLCARDLANQVCALTDRQALSESGVMLRNSTGSVVVDMSANQRGRRAGHARRRLERHPHRSAAQSGRLVGRCAEFGVGCLRALFVPYFINYSFVYCSFFFFVIICFLALCCFYFIFFLFIIIIILVFFLLCLCLSFVWMFFSPSMEIYIFFTLYCFYFILFFFVLSCPPFIYNLLGHFIFLSTPPPSVVYSSEPSTPGELPALPVMGPLSEVPSRSAEPPQPQPRNDDFSDRQRSHPASRWTLRSARRRSHRPRAAACAIRPPRWAGGHCAVVVCSYFFHLLILFLELY